MSIKIYPSLLSADLLNLEKEIAELNNLMPEASADGIHWDVMDGHFVDDITFGINTIKAARCLTNIRFDVHLMVANPEKHIDAFINAGADAIIIHQESCENNLSVMLNEIRAKNVLVGVALNPSTKISAIEHCIKLLDIVLVMTVNPGKCGQIFLKNQLNKIKELHNISNNLGLQLEICVDGGINCATIKNCIHNGARSFVTGSFLFKNERPYTDTIQMLKQS